MQLLEGATTGKGYDWKGLLLEGARARAGGARARAGGARARARAGAAIGALSTRARWRSYYWKGLLLEGAPPPGHEGQQQLVEPPPPPRTRNAPSFCSCTARALRSSVPPRRRRHRCACAAALADAPLPCCPAALLPATEGEVGRSTGAVAGGWADELRHHAHVDDGCEHVSAYSCSRGSPWGLQLQAVAHRCRTRCGRPGSCTSPRLRR